MSALIDRYDRHAEGYLRWWAPVLAPTSRRVLDRLERRDPGLAVGEPRDVLDLGTGTGTLSLAAVARWPGVRVTAVDASAGMLAVAEREAAERPPRERRRLRFEHADAAALPVRDGAFDAVVSSFMVQLVPERAAVLREAARVLRPGGLVSLVGWLVDETPFAPEDALEDALDEARVERPPDEEVRSGDFRSPRSAAGELRRAGFRRVHAEEDVVAWDWTAADYAAYRGYREEDLLEPLPARQRDVFWSAFRRRLAALTADELRFRAPVAALVGVRGELPAR